MALYIPPGQRRRRSIAVAIATLVIGVVVGVLIGRALAPSIDDRVSSVQSDARQTAAGLRVLVLHDEAGVTSQAPGNGGADLVLDVRGETVRNDAGELADAIARNSRHLGPVTVTPDAWVVSGARLLQVPTVEPSAILDTAAAIAVNGTRTTVIIGRE